MKTTTKTTIILKAIDRELRAILKKDIQHFKMNVENKQGPVKSAA